MRGKRVTVTTSKSRRLFSCKGTGKQHSPGILFVGTSKIKGDKRGATTQIECQKSSASLGGFKSKLTTRTFPRLASRTSVLGRWGKKLSKTWGSGGLFRKEQGNSTLAVLFPEITDKGEGQPEKISS